ncbi:hypothetical protein DFO68_1456, partial [Halomonas ventosae]
YLPHSIPLPCKEKSAPYERAPPHGASQGSREVEAMVSGPMAEIEEGIG